MRSGEIVGLFGLVGAGRSELKGLFGGTQITGGQVYIDGQPVHSQPAGHLCRDDAVPGGS